jgi:septum site-determining protein MinC
VLRLRSSDIQLVNNQLRVRISQLPHMFLHAPVLIDLGALEEASPLTVIQVVAILKACKLVPVAATNVPVAMMATIANEGLGILQAPPAPGRTRNLDAEIDAMPDPDLPTPPPQRLPRKEPPPTPPPRAAQPAPAPMVVPPFAGPVVVRQPVRGGQVIYAQNNDLVVLAPVNAGAQVVADGHVHIYAKLRGRAVAGAKGLPGARIFCQRLEAELVAVSDKYMSADEIPPALRGKPAQIWLENGECKAAPL